MSLNDDKLLEMIKKSADEIPVPDTLIPDEIEKKLTQEPSDNTPNNNIRKPKITLIYRTGAVAAAALLLVISIWGLSKTDTGLDASTTSDETAVYDSAAESASSSESDTKVNVPDSINEYEDLYNAMEEYSLRDQIVYDRNWLTSGGAESAVEESVTSSGRDTAASSTSADTGAESVSVPAYNPDEAVSSDYSETNVRTEGVDEGDIVKTDGKYIYVVEQNQGIHIVDAASMEEITLLPLPDYNETIMEMYLDGSTLQLVASGTTSNLSGSGDSDDDSYRLDVQETTTVYTYDITDPANVSLSGKVSQSGSYSSSRKKGDYLYLFSTYYASIPDNASQLEKYVPQAGDGFIPVDDIYVPSQIQNTQYLVISSVNMKKPNKIVNSKSILSGAELFYVSSSRIFIANTNWNNDAQITELMSFNYKKGKITAQAGGTVKGYLNNSFSLDEYDGYLRIVSTSWNSQKQIDINTLSILDKNLNIVSKIDDLAPDETIQSARFMEDIGYFVTFRQMDPLFSVDLSDPKNPKILGELKITGFSEYLHPYDDNLLLGIGWEADPDTGDTTGLKLSMFDISNPANVKEKHKLVIEGVYNCPAMDAYKAVMIDPEKNLFGFAYQTNLDASDRKYTTSADKSSSSYSLFSYDKKKGFTSEFTYNLSNESAYSDYYNSLESIRGLYIGGTFYLSTDGALSSFNMAKDFTQEKKLNW